MNWAKWKALVIVPAVVMAADLMLWIALTVVGIGYLSHTRLKNYSGEIFSVLLGTWEFLHAPVTNALMPSLIQYMPSHGGGIPAILAEIVYVSACMVWLGLLSVLFVFGYRFVSRKYRMRRSGSQDK